MLNPGKSPLKLAHISLLLIGLMWVFPFLDYYHAYPLTTFYQEWGTAMLGVAAMVLLTTRSYWSQPEFPRIVLLPVALLFLVVLQFELGKLPYFGQALLYALYLVWAALLMLLGVRLRDELGLAAVVSTLAVFLLIGAELNAIIGIIQHFQWHTPLDHVITMKISAAVFGNVAQPNHYADYLTLGLISLGVLYARGTLPVWLTVLFTLPILFVLPLTGSREVWFYLLALVLLELFWQRRNGQLQALLKYSLVLLLGFGLMHLVIQLPQLAGTASSTNTVQRLFAGDVHSGGIRLYLWHEAWLILTQYPLLGAGFGQFGWQHFVLTPVLHDAQISGYYNNAHNLVMQLAAETGLAGLAILFVSLLFWLRQAWSAERTIYHWWGYSVLAVLGIHSMLEYPLWYTYFLGIAALVLGLLDFSCYRPSLRGAGRVNMYLVLVLGVLSLQQLLSGYRNLENVSVLRPQSGNDAAYFERLHDTMTKLRANTLLQPYAELFDSSMLEISPRQLDAKLAMNDRTMHFIPIATAVYQDALLLAQNGEEQAAEMQMKRAIWSYSGEFPEQENKLRELAGRDAAHFSALLEFAVREYEEYKRDFDAVHSG